MPGGMVPALDNLLKNMMRDRDCIDCLKINDAYAAARLRRRRGLGPIGWPPLPFTWLSDAQGIDLFEQLIPLVLVSH